MMIPINKAPLLLTLLIVAASPLLGQDTSCGIVWDPPVLLSDTSYDAHSPKIALSGDDTVHITWENATIARPRLPYVRSIDGGSTLLAAVELLVDSVLYPYSSHWNSIVATHGRVHVFFVGPEASYTHVRMVASANNGETWGNVQEISPDSAGLLFSAAVGGDTLCLVYPPRGGDNKLLRSTNGGQTWLRTNEDMNYDARVAVGNGILHLTQIGIAIRGETEYRRSQNLGDTWQQRMFLSSIDTHQSSDPAVAVGTEPGDSIVVVTWTDSKYGCLALSGCSILGRIGVVGSDSTIWGPEEVLTDIPMGYQSSVSVRGSQVAVAWPMDQTTSPYAEVRVRLRDTWCPSFDPTFGVVTEVVGSVDVKVSSKAVHVVWFASQGPSPGTFRVFYRRGRFINTEAKIVSTVAPPFVSLSQNYPNPFNPSTKISYRVEHRGFVELKVYDVLGREVATLVNERKGPGEYVVEWNAEGVPSGVYLYRLVKGDRVEAKKAVILK